MGGQHSVAYAAEETFPGLAISPAQLDHALRDERVVHPDPCMAECIDNHVAFGRQGFEQSYGAVGKCRVVVGLGIGYL